MIAQRSARFAVIFYARIWFAASSAHRAPRTYLQYLLTSISVDVAEVLCRHLWYLKEELVPLAFFDDGVSNGMKLHMIQALKKPAIEMSNIRIVIDHKDKSVPKQSLANFISIKAALSLRSCHCQCYFFQIDPSTENGEYNYSEAKNYGEEMNVANDNAERVFNTHSSHKE